MLHLTGLRRVAAISAAACLITAISGTALAMIDPGLASRAQAPNRKVELSTSTFESPTGTPEPSPTPKSDHEVGFSGIVQSIATTGWLISGHTVIVTSQTEVDSGIDIGSQVKVEGTAQSDGSITARQIKLVVNDDNENGNANSNENENENENENHNGNVNSNENENENHNGNLNSNEDNGNDNEHENQNGNVNSNEDNQHSGDGQHENGDHNGRNHNGSSGDHNGGGDDHGNGD